MLLAANLAYAATPSTCALAPTPCRFTPLTVQRCSHVLSLLTLGDFDPFADDYPAAVVESEKTRVRLVTTAGACDVVVDRALSPAGVDRFLTLVEDNFFEDMLLYRVLPGFLVQFGCAADPLVHARWQDARIPDEPNRATFRGGTLSFAGSGPDSRSCHLFVALSPQGAELGNAAHEATLGHVQEVEVFEKVAANFESSGYPDLGEALQDELMTRGNAAAEDYPQLDRIIRAEIVDE